MCLFLFLARVAFLISMHKRISLPALDRAIIGDTQSARIVVFSIISSFLILSTFVIFYQAMTYDTRHTASHTGSTDEF